MGDLGQIPIRKDTPGEENATRPIFSTGVNPDRAEEPDGLQVYVRGPAS